MNNLEKNENMTDCGNIRTKKDGITIECVTVIGQIEGHYLLPENQKTTKYEHMIPMITDIEQSEEVKGMLLILNTVGGDVEAGLALAELIASMSKPTVSLVLGGGHSIGVPLAVCAKRSFIVPSATMTLHPVRITGMVIGAPQTYSYFKDMQDRITGFITRHSRCQRQQLEELMMTTDKMATDIGSIVDGKTAVDIGLIDQTGGLSDALKCLNEMIKEDSN